MRGVSPPLPPIFFVKTAENDSLQEKNPSPQGIGRSKEPRKRLSLQKSDSVGSCCHFLP